MSRVEPQEIRKLAVDFTAREGRTIIGRAMPYNVTADTGMFFTERFRPGVFTKSIAEAARALPLLREHEWDALPLGRAMAWDDTDEALYGTWELDSRAEAKEAYRLVDEGYLRGLSVGFLPIRSDWTETEADGGQKAHVDRVEARLVETSLCNVPVFEGAGVLATRSLGRPGHRPTPELDAARAWLATIRTK
jgi:hypothetical protein